MHALFQPYQIRQHSRAMDVQALSFRATLDDIRMCVLQTPCLSCLHPSSIDLCEPEIGLLHTQNALIPDATKVALLLFFVRQVLR